MKVDIISTRQIFPATRQDTTIEKHLPAIDAWYAFVRTQAMICMFEAPKAVDRAEIAPKLIDTLSRTLDTFRLCAGRLSPSAITVHGQDGSAKTVKRPKVIWGGDEDVGVEFIEAHTNTRLTDLIPSAQPNSPGFIWNRSASKFELLFPKQSTSESLVRMQVTLFSCGGISIGIDTDHAFADGYVCGMFMRQCSALFNDESTVKLLTPTYQGAELDQEILKDHTPQRDTPSTTYRPKVRTPWQRDLASPPVGVTNGDKEEIRTVPCMLHISSKRYQRIAETTQTSAAVPITDHVAVAAILWAALNRARQQTKRYTVDCHMSISLRGPLELPAGLIGSPFLGIMLPCGDDTNSTDVSRLAIQMTDAMQAFDEAAMRDTVYEAKLEDSPSGSTRTPFTRDRMTFTSAAQSGWDQLSFGKPLFIAPLLPWDNLFVMVEDIKEKAEEPVFGGVQKWYRNGVKIFFHVTQDVFEALTSDAALADFEVIQDV